MISLCPLTILPCSPLEQIDAAVDAGFDAIGLRLTRTLATDLDVMADRSLREAIAKRLSVTGIKVLDIEVVRISPDTDVAALEPLLQYAEDVGARSIAVTGLPKGEGRHDEAATVGKLAELCEAAAKHRTTPALEFMVYRSVDTLASAVRVRDLVDHPNLTICLDALHFQRSGGAPADLARIDLTALSCFQICDAPALAPADLPHEARCGRLLPGEGDLPLGELMAALPAELPIAVEAPDLSRSGMSVRDKARAAAEATRKVMASAGRAWR